VCVCVLFLVVYCHVTFYSLTKVLRAMIKQNELNHFD